jgi:uncharacterized membrane protein
MRLAWLDLFRGVAVLAMIETHVVNTFLAAPLRESAWFPWLHYANGLVAPGFLFIAGYAQGLGMRRTAGAPRAVGRKFRRLGMVALLGYALHFPAPQIFSGQWREAVRLWTQVDILHCLAVSLALLLLLEWRARRWADSLAVVLTLAAVFGAPLARGWQFSPEWLRAWFNTSTGSLFPLLPWVGFAGAGFLASGVARWLAPRPLAVVAGLVAGAFVVPGEVGFFSQRLAWLLAAVPLVQWIAGRMAPRLVLFAGRESLVMYAAHLLLLEALALAGLPRVALGVTTVALLFAAVLAVTFAIAALWSARDSSPLAA